MPNLGALLNEEIRRLARKEIRVQMDKTQKAAAKHRREIAELKRQVQQQQKRIDFLENRERERVAKADVDPSLAEGARFSPQWLRSHRKRLRLTAQEYAVLAGVSMQSIYQWERGVSKPRKPQLASLVALRGLGRREALAKLKMLDTAPPTSQKRKRGNGQRGNP